MINVNIEIRKGKRVKTLTLFLILLTILSSFPINLVSAETRTYVVALDGSGDYRTIQQAINAVPSTMDAVIIVKAGTWILNPNYDYPYQPITVRNRLTIRGAGIDKTIIKVFPSIQPAGSSRRSPVILSKTSISNLLIEDMTLIQSGTPDNKGTNAIELRSGTNTGVTIRNVKIRDSPGAGITVQNINNLVIQGCDISNAQTGITLLGGKNALISGNRIKDTRGDGIFPQTISIPLTDSIIENNYLENTGDTGIDCTSYTDRGPHERIIIRGNTLVNGHIRISYAEDIDVIGNTLTEGFINVDNGKGETRNILVKGNKITTSESIGIGIYGAWDSQIIDNLVTLKSSTATQAGIQPVIKGAGLVEGNTITNPRNYGINFKGWGQGGTQQLVIRDNIILDPGDIGIWDDGKSQGPVLVENNIIWDRKNPFASEYGIYTQYTDNRWTIRNNYVYAGRNDYIRAPSSTLSGNIYTPPPSIPDPEPDPEPDPDPTPEPTPGVFFEDGFESRDFSNWSGSDSTSGDELGTTSSTAYQGTYSAVFTSNGDGTTEYAYVYDSLNVNEVYVRGYFYLDGSLPLSDEGDRLYLLRVSGSNQNLVYAGVRRSDGRNVWTMYTRDGSQWTGWTDASTGPVLNAWQSVELHWKMDGNNGVMELFVGGSRVISVTGVDTSYYGSAREVDFGLPYSSGLDGGLRLYGDSVKMSTVYIGPETIVQPAIFKDDFESGNFNEWDSTTTTSGETIGVVNSRSYDGDYSARFSSDADGSIEYTYAYNQISETDVYARGYFYVSSGLKQQDDGDRFYIMRLNGASQSLVYAGVRRVNGVERWALYTRDGSQWTGWTYATNVVPREDVWHRVELHWKMDSNNGVVELFVDGNKVISVTGVDTSYYGRAVRMDVGIPYANGLDNPLYVYADNFLLSDNYVGA